MCLLSAHGEIVCACVRIVLATSFWSRMCEPRYMNVQGRWGAGEDAVDKVAGLPPQNGSKRAICFWTD